jgi:TonB-linked SusC/RagA family outer membrane protein
VFTSNDLEVNFPFVEGLTYRVNGGIDFQDWQRGEYWGRNTQTGYSSQGEAHTYNQHRYNWTLENVLHYQRSFGRHAIDLTALYSQESDLSEEHALESDGFPNDVLTYYQADVGQVVIPSYSYSKSGIVSQMVRMNYSFADRILATGTVRRDGFSGFGADHKYGVFPSLALGWNLANEHFWRWSNSVPTFKVRASWGENGNEAIRPYQTLATLGQNSYVDGNTTAPGYIPTTLANPDLRWETTAQTNLGIDFGVMKNRVTGTLDLYWSRTHDLLLQRSISPVEGITSVLQNIGKTANRGIEFSVTTHNIERGKTLWETTFNIAANRNRIVDLYGNGQDDIANGWFIGKPIDVNYGYMFGGIWQQADSAEAASFGAKPGDVRVKDLNGDGTIGPDDRTIIGSLQPSYTAGLTNVIHYGRFSLSAFFNSIKGITRANPLLSPTVVGPQVRYNTVVLNYWSPSNPINSYPANREGVNPYSVGFYQNSSFIRLQDLNFGVDLPTSLWPAAGATRLHLYVDAKNLWTSTSWTGLDPEFTSGNQRGAPLARTFIFGLDLGF